MGTSRLEQAQRTETPGASGDRAEKATYGPWALTQGTGAGAPPHLSCGLGEHPAAHGAQNGDVAGPWGRFWVDQEGGTEGPAGLGVGEHRDRLLDWGPVLPSKGESRVTGHRPRGVSGDWTGRGMGRSAG